MEVSAVRDQAKLLLLVNNNAEMEQSHYPYCTVDTRPKNTHHKSTNCTGTEFFFFCWFWFRGKTVIFCILLTSFILSDLYKF